jgi:aminoglycoside phosphotransferase (APT) family kinase protein
MIWRPASRGRSRRDRAPVAAGRRDELYAQATALPPSVAEPVLAHGDLHLRHLFVSADGAATAVIDWDDTYRADPALDLMLVYGGFVGAARTNPP